MGSPPRQLAVLALLLILLLLRGASGGAGIPLGQLLHRRQESTAPAAALYVFGDSTADVGNNNYLHTSARANFPHNGVDFPRSRPTGRFSNGFNGVDFLARHMGFKRSPPPLLSLLNNASRLVTRSIDGLNFASGGSGILDSTGTNSLTLSEQIRYYGSMKSNLTSYLNAKQLDHQFLSKAIFLISTGGNDIFDFFTTNGSPSNKTKADQFISQLIYAYRDRVEELYSLGARKFGAIGVAPLGCCPRFRAGPTGGCNEVLNGMAADFNEGAEAMFYDLAFTHPEFRYSFGRSYNVVMSIISDPGALGYTEVRYACCGGGSFNGRSGCTPNATLCPDRGGHLFWDFLHPTHRTSKLAGLAIYDGAPHFTSPVSFRQLIDL